MPDKLGELVQVVVAMDFAKLRQRTRIEAYSTVDEAQERMDEFIEMGYDTVSRLPRRLGEHVEPEPLPEGFFDA